MSFAQELADTAIKRAKSIQDMNIKKIKEFEEAKFYRENELMTNLTKKYHSLVKKALWDSALIAGKREKYMNFEREDFKANFPGLGTPKDVCQRWLSEMTKINSPYLPFKPLPLSTNWGSDPSFENIAALADSQFSVSTPPTKDHFAGINFDVWNNKNFTIHFTW